MRWTIFASSALMVGLYLASADAAHAQQQWMLCYGSDGNNVVHAIFPAPPGATELDLQAQWQEFIATRHRAIRSSGVCRSHGFRPSYDPSFGHDVGFTPATPHQARGGPAAVPTPAQVPNGVFMFCRIHDYQRAQNLPGSAGTTPAYYSEVFPVQNYVAPNEGTISGNLRAQLRQHVERTYQIRITTSSQQCEVAPTRVAAEALKESDQRELLRSGFASSTRLVETGWVPN